MSGKDSALMQPVQAFVAAESQPEAVGRWVDRIATPVLQQSPEVLADPVLAQLVHETVRAHWLAFLVTLTEPPREFRLVQAAADMAIELPRRGHPLTVLFRLYRVAQQAVWEFVTAITPTIAKDDAAEADFLVFFWGRVSAWLDASIESSVELFQEERDKIRQGAAAQVVVAVRSILDGTSTSDPRQLSAALGGHPISSYNTALLLRAHEVDRVAELREAATLLARTAQSRNPLIVSPGGRDLWCWFATRSAPDLETLRECEPWLRERGISVAVGSSRQGAPGFALSHREAQRAQSIAFRARRAGQLTLFSDVELLSLLDSGGEAAQRFVLRTLGGLADDGEGPSRLRQTLHALLSTGSVDEASKQLSVHKNTVRYRVSQAEALLGFPAAQAPTEVELALRYYDAFLVKDPTR